jgi:PAS domain S-box-containing protein
MATRGSTSEQTSQINNIPTKDRKPILPPEEVADLSRGHFSYFRLFFFLVISVFLAEVAAMILISGLPPLPYGYITLIDAGIMTLLIFPFLYYLSFRPLIRHIEKRKLVEATNRQLSRIVQQTEDTVIVTNRDGIIEYVNPAFERLTGYTKEEALGKTPRLFRSDLHDKQFYHSMWSTILKGNIFQGEIANRKKDGELFYEVKTITPLRDAQGNITHFVATGKDITQHKLDEEKLLKAYDELELRVWQRTEELKIANAELEDEIRIRRQIESELRKSEQRLNRAQEIAHLGSWELDLISNQLTWSDEVYRIFGLQPREFDATYEAFLEAVHPDDRAAVDAAYSGSIRGGQDRYEMEHRVVRRPSGEIRVVHEKCEHFRNEAGQIIRSVGMVHDITERKKAEDARREAAERFRIVADFTHDWEYWRGVDNHFHYISPSCEDITGYSREAFNEDPDLFLQIIHSDDRERLAAHYRDDLSSDQAYDIEFRIVRCDGQERWLGHTCRLIRDSEGKILGRRASNRDITERKQAEEALRRAHDELEVRVGERTKELAAANRDLLKEIAERKEIERRLRLQTTAMEAAANGIIITDHQGNIQWANPALAQISGYGTDELIGQTMRIFRSGQNSIDYYDGMWNTILSGEVWQGETINRRKDGSLYIEEQTITPVKDEDGRIPHFISIKQDITKRKQDENELERRNTELQIISEAERSHRQISEALVGAALIVNKSLKLSEVLSLILEQIREVIPYQLADIALLEGDSFYDACHRGDLPWPAALMGVNNRFLIENFPLLMEMRQSGKPLLILDTQKRPDWDEIEGMSWIRSLLSAPLLVEQKVMGFVTLFSDQPEFFSADMSNHLVAFAAHAAVAIQNAWLFEQVQASTDRLQFLSRRLVEIQENERLYISRELHDEAGQVLTSLLVDLRLLEKNISEPRILQKIVTEMESSLNGVIENLHRIAMALRPASLDHVGLVAALRQHTESVAEKHGLYISFTSGGDVERLPANVETVLYRIVQEALTNTVRHAHATRVDVVLTVRDGKLIVIIEDDGVGFDPQTAPAGAHLGLFGMRERAEMIDAKLMIESSPGSGTTILMEVSYADTIVSRG